ncbi:DUF2089 domain-containing protein [Tessaracoccus sp. OS52]|uniref:DUF2089 domain-containing protein n=1 Tax=Tessaracoccus sp. OS52 TaxID=2886691 RepID=UPI001D12853B|nr:DUF2089 domain-containing protein [Tessaracoccus sp. OS52]MCC2593571.1 DUF2089 domain-containing protein [Tessaracoccus sp. OS52]
MAHHLYHAPADCPVCGDELIITRKGCLKCGTELAGEFASCAYCALEDSDHEILRVFLSSRGNLREVEKHLGVSYPTARARLDAVIAKLGFAPATSDEPGEAPDGETPQEQILARVQSGEISAEVGAQLIANL